MDRDLNKSIIIYIFTIFCKTQFSNALYFAGDCSVTLAKCLVHFG